MILDVQASNSRMTCVPGHLDRIKQAGQLDLRAEMSWPEKPPGLTNNKASVYPGGHTSWPGGGQNYKVPEVLGGLLLLPQNKNFSRLS